MTGFCIEFDAEALARAAWGELPWWQRLLAGFWPGMKEDVIADVVRNLTKEG